MVDAAIHKLTTMHHNKLILDTLNAVIIEIIFFASTATPHRLYYSLYLKSLPNLLALISIHYDSQCITLSLTLSTLFANYTSLYMRSGSLFVSLVGWKIFETNEKRVMKLMTDG